MEGTALWITGLPGSGKSTLADALKELFPDFVVLRMDELRKIVTPDPTYSDLERDLIYRSLVFLAVKLTQLGHNVIIDATGHRRQWRQLARELIPRFVEVFLLCSQDVCISRERQRSTSRGAPKDIYKKGEAGWPVPGINVAYEKPPSPEITINTDVATIGDSVNKIKVFLDKCDYR